MSKLPARFDGRLFVLVVVLLCGGFLTAMSFAGRATLAWKIVGAVPQTASSRDLRTMPDAARCYAAGQNVYFRNDCDVEKRSYNYPRVWLMLPRLGLTSENVDRWRFGASAIFFAVVLLSLGRLSPGEGVFAAAAVCAPAVWFGIETANTDYWIFSIVGVGLLALRRGWRGPGYLLLLISALLKLFPAAAFSTVLRERSWTRRIAIGAALASVFGMYLYLNLQDIVQMVRGTPHMTYISFGRTVLFEGALGLSPEAAGAASLVVLGLCAALAVAAMWRIAQGGLRIDMDGGSLDAFRAGASIFLLAFSAPSSFDYRLIFLLFTLPQLFAWARGGGNWAVACRGALLAILVTLWAYRGPWTRLGLDELANWSLFLFLATALLLTIRGAFHETAVSRQ